MDTTLTNQRQCILLAVETLHRASDACDAAWNFADTDELFKKVLITLMDKVVSAGWAEAGSTPGHVLQLPCRNIEGSLLQEGGRLAVAFELEEKARQVEVVPARMTRIVCLTKGSPHRHVQRPDQTTHFRLGIIVNHRDADRSATSQTERLDQTPRMKIPMTDADLLLIDAADDVAGRFTFDAEGYCGHAQGGRGASLPNDPDIISGTKPRQELLADFRLVFGDGFERTLDRRPALVLAEPLQIIDGSGAAPGQLVVRIAGLQLRGDFVFAVEVVVESV